MCKTELHNSDNKNVNFVHACDCVSIGRRMSADVLDIRSTVVSAKIR
jgi:hypothetical protein